MKKFAIFEMRIRYENLKNIGLCFIAFCLFQADGYAFEAGPLSFMKIWKNVDGFDYPVFVSTQGEIEVVVGKTKRRLYPFDSHGYKKVALKVGGKYKHLMAHRLVAKAFIPNPENKPQVNHINGNKADNRVENLEWCTAKENNVHAYRTGLKVLPKGKSDKRSKPILQFDLNGNLVREWESSRHPERELGFRQGCIMNCISGRQKTAHGFIWKRA